MVNPVHHLGNHVSPPHRGRHVPVPPHFHSVLVVTAERQEVKQHKRVFGFHKPPGTNTVDSNAFNRNNDNKLNL